MNTYPVPPSTQGKQSGKGAGRPRQRTLGPVSDLERHLPDDWWRTLFNAVYLKTDGDIVENLASTSRDVDLLVGAVGLEPNDRILDLCCGQGRHAIELARRGFKHVSGIDRSRYLIRLARKRARDIGVAVDFREGDARRFRFGDGNFDCVCLIGNSFGYFDRHEDDIAVLTRVKRALRSHGMLVLDIVDGAWMRDNFEPRTWEWIDQQHFVCRERSLDRNGERLVSREVVVHAERGVIADQFYAERLYDRETIAKLLESLGFDEVFFHEAPEHESARNQDLGMLSRRNFLIAKGPRRAAVSPKRSNIRFPEVTVLLGDPRLPDHVKKGGVFNKEDMDTVGKLKSALDELEGYTFSYLDNHAAMLGELRRNPPAFVLNLCDEGYANDAFKELHVPAYLEMQGIPYSGAGPTCLGVCYDKSLVGAIAASLDIPVPLETYFDPDDQAASIPLDYPALIKPNTGDSSIGITAQSVVHSPREADQYLTYLRKLLPGRPILIQEYLDGPEYSVSVIGNPGHGYTVLPVLEVDFTKLDPSLPPILSYESKWDPESPYWTDIGFRETDVPDELKRSLSDHSCRLFERVGCRDYARFDFRTDRNGKVKMLEINPNPGWCWDGKLNLMAGFGGYRYADLLRMIIEAAQGRAVATASTDATAMTAA